MQIVQGTARPAVVELAGWPHSPEAHRFVKVRKQYFEAIRSAPKDLVTQGADPLALKPLVLEYAGAYLDMVQSVASRAGSAAAVCTMFLSAGSSTLSMTWMTPLLAVMSVAVMVDVRLRPSVMTSEEPTASILKMPPCTVVIALPAGTSALSTLAGSTW